MSAHFLFFVIRYRHHARGARTRLPLGLFAEWGSLFESDNTITNPAPNPSRPIHCGMRRSCRIFASMAELEHALLARIAHSFDDNESAEQ
jgi:hypothetical protein